MPEPNLISIIADLATIGAAIAAIGAAIAAIWGLKYIAGQAKHIAEQVRISSEQTRHMADQVGISLKTLQANQKTDIEAKTLEIINRYNDPNLTSHITRAMNFIRDSNKSENEKWTIFNDDLNMKASVILTLNYFEQVGVMYNDRLIDRKLVSKFIKTIAVTYFDQAGWLIRKHREKQPTAWLEWEKMKNDLQTTIY